MAPNADPWRTLGLAPGATQDEIRRAYRRLAKINHPDAAGDGALPRFLAIQQAYDQLAGPGRARRSGARPAPAPPPTADPREPWRADPGRARASGRADGRRAPGARPAGSRSTGSPSPGPTPSEPSSPGAQGGGGAGSAGSAGSAGTAGSAGSPGSAGSAGPGARRSSSRRRASNRATPGSTSYEGADQEPFEPGWSGATWYGASSGTYWTINPKEYADPRKHGPEYQARARRAARPGRIEDGAIDSDASDGPADRMPGPTPDPGERGDAEPARRTTGQAGPDAPDAPESPGETRPPDAQAPRSSPSRPAWTSAAAREARDGSPVDEARSTARANTEATRPPRRPAAEPADGSAAHQPGDARQRNGRTAGDARPRGSPRFGTLRDFVEEPPPGRFSAPVLREPTTPMGRLAMAFLGWPPLGIFLAAAIDDSTGCGRYAASCSEISSPGTWIVNAVLVLLLLALPRLATWSAHGSIVALVVGVPAAVALSAGGGSNVPEASGPVLIAVLAVAYLAGLAYAVVRQVQLRSGRVLSGRRVP